MKVLLICGYRRTGKDTLYEKLIRSDHRFSWYIYQHPDRVRAVFSEDESYIRTAFADALKLEVSREYDLPVFVFDKDRKQFVHPETGAMVSARDLYIEWGALRRAADPDYWCKSAFSQIATDSWIVVTDWRFQNESKYTRSNFEDTITCRLYRSDIIEPEIEIRSEHELDAELTDLLLVPDRDMEFERARHRFPQYQDYVLTGRI